MNLEVDRMESLNNLKERLHIAQNELDKITIKKHNTVPWSQGEQDQSNLNSFTYDEYTDVCKAYKLKSKIFELEDQIATYSQRAQQEEKMEKNNKESQTKEYEYSSLGKIQTTTNSANDARYDAQHRFFGVSKLNQTILTLSGQKRKFKRLWIKASNNNEKTQEQVAYELNKIFR